jgi:hypothetical protein
LPSEEDEQGNIILSAALEDEFGDADASDDDDEGEGDE